MLERVIEDWLTKSTERSFQAPFCQMLAGRGETIVHSSRHCAMELGKDVISIAPSGRVHAYQLKSAPHGRISLSEWRKGLQEQAIDLVTSAVRHPSIQGKRHHRSFFVVNGTLNEEVSEAIERLNDGFQNQGLKDCRLETIVYGQMLEMATDLESAFWPTEIGDANILLEMYLDSGLGQLPKDKMSSLLESTMKLNSTEPLKLSGPKRLRLMASSGVLCALALSRFTNANNCVAEIEAWAIQLSCVLGLSQRLNIPEKKYESSIALPAMFIQSLLEQLATEVRENPSLVVGNPYTDSFVRRVRITHIVSLLSVLWLWRRYDGVAEDDLDEFLRDFCVSNQNELAIWGDGAAPQIIASYWGMCSMNPSYDTDRVLLSNIDFITSMNGKGGAGKIYSPYYSSEEVYEHAREIVQDKMEESFRNKSHCLESFLALAVRENLRQGIQLRWPDISYVMFAEFEAEKKWHEFRWRNFNVGRVVQRMPTERQSWKELRSLYGNVNAAAVPKVLRKNPIYALLLMICYPHRMRPEWVVWLDGEFRQ